MGTREAQAGRERAADLGFALGAPVWACAAWIGGWLPAGTRRADLLRAYGRRLNAVEGNTSFYAVPPTTSVAAWDEQAPEGFAFCWKVPRTITHARQLRGARDETLAFLERMAPLRDRSGPLLVQLPPTYGPEGLDLLGRFLDFLGSRGWEAAVDVRHAAFFAGGEAEAALDDLLRRHRVDRAIFDTGCLFAGPTPDDATAEAKAKKPALPRRATVTGPRPFLRFVGRNDPVACDPWTEAWAETIAGWLRDGLEPVVFCHTPDDVHAPVLCSRLHAAVRRRLPALPAMPAGGEGAASQDPPKAGQLELF